MNRKTFFTAVVIAAVFAMSVFAQARVPVANAFASDSQTVPVMANTRGVGGALFESYVGLFNPTSSSFPVNVSLYDGAGVRRNAVIMLAAGELKTYENFLASVFNYAGGGAVTFASADSAGGLRNNRFIVSSEVRSGRFATTVPVLEFAGSSSRSFSAGISVNSSSRTNIGCFNQSSESNRVRATFFDNSGKQTLGSLDLNLAPNAWGQTAVTSIVSDGYVQFDPADAAVCYAVVVDNSTNDGRFVAAAEYRP